MWNPLQVKIESYILSKTTKPSKSSLATGHIFILGPEEFSRAGDIFQDHALPWQVESLLGAEASKKESIQFVGPKGPVWLFMRQNRQGPFSHHARLEDSVYSWHRDQVGAIFSLIQAYRIQKLQVNFFAVSDEAIAGSLVGFDLGAYSFREVSSKKAYADLPSLEFHREGKPLAKKLLEQAANISCSVNWARHLVNTPPNILNPTSFSALAKKVLASPTTKVEVWNEQRLKKENMGLHLAVGAGALHPPALVVIRYRPRTKVIKLKQQPLAFVGKGVTFDSGGLDIKPSSGMRLMKKDMGGAAAIFGLAYWASKSQYPAPVDFYLGLAENSVDAKSFRPGDVVQSRQGALVEIHNTDAEGRLVLADALNVAVTAKPEPRAVIDVATLTGAIKAGLGAELSGLFSNSDELCDELLKAGQRAGDLSWRMPLYSRVGIGSSSFADMVNATDGFGGAVSAALFLEKFVQSKPWAHFDIYAWNDKPTGALGFAGGSGQAVQCLIEFLKGTP